VRFAEEAALRKTTLEHGTSLSPPPLQNAMRPDKRPIAIPGLRRGFLATDISKVRRRNGMSATLNRPACHADTISALSVGVHLGVLPKLQYEIMLNINSFSRRWSLSPVHLVHRM
jgi:hypothetical protein